MAEAIDYIENVACPKLSEACKHEDFILNMGQTPIPFTFDSQNTLDVSGTRTFHIRKSTGDAKQATFAMTITSSGKS
jgi:hypothetical protein